MKTKKRNTLGAALLAVAVLSMGFGNLGHATDVNNAVPKMNGQLEVVRMADEDVLYTGKPYDKDLGTYAFKYREYHPEFSRWTSADPSGFPDGANNYAYITNDPLRWLDADGLAGVLIIYSYSDGEGSSSDAGHSWISYEQEGGTFTTYGTWGNNPTGQGNGLFTNEETVRQFTPDVYRGTHLDNEEEGLLINVINDYFGRGTGAWSLTNPCSGFASNAWRQATGEILHDGWPASTPTTLKGSIYSKNENETWGWLE
jgi:RHS repeat-associated protein